MDAHWPLGPQACACGDKFPTRAAHWPHARAYVLGWSGVWLAPAGASAPRGVVYEARAWTQGFGHAFRVKRSNLNPRRWRLICRCGWEMMGTLREIRGAGHQSIPARDHLRAVIRGRIDGSTE